MSKKDQAKKKERDERVRKKILAVRKGIRSQRKVLDDKEREQRALRKVTNRIEGKTFRHASKDQDGVVNTLAHNYDILKALEEEQRLIQKKQEDAPLLNTIGLDDDEDAQNDGEEENVSEEKMVGLRGEAEVEFISGNGQTEEDDE